MSSAHSASMKTHKKIKGGMPTFFGALVGTEKLHAFMECTKLEYWLLQ